MSPPWWALAAIGGGLATAAAGGVVAYRRVVPRKLPPGKAPAPGGFAAPPELGQAAVVVEGVDAPIPRAPGPEVPLREIEHSFVLDSAGGKVSRVLAVSPAPAPVAGTLYFFGWYFGDRWPAETHAHWEERRAKHRAFAATGHRWAFGDVACWAGDYEGDPPLFVASSGPVQSCSPLQSLPHLRWRHAGGSAWALLADLDLTDSDYLMLGQFVGELGGKLGG